MNQARSPGRAVGQLLDATIGLRYQPWLAAIWLAFLPNAAPSSIPLTSRMPCRAGRYRHSTPSLGSSICLIPIDAFRLRNAHTSAGPTRLRKPDTDGQPTRDEPSSGRVHVHASRV